jgi:hypothetical protein
MVNAEVRRQSCEGPVTARMQKSGLGPRCARNIHKAEVRLFANWNSWSLDGLFSAVVLPFPSIWSQNPCYWGRSLAHDVVVEYSPQTGGFADMHERVTRAVVAKRLATLMGLPMGANTTALPSTLVDSISSRAIP